MSKISVGEWVQYTGSDSKVTIRDAVSKVVAVVPGEATIECPFLIGKFTVPMKDLALVRWSH
jgi:hypothetical protein